MKKFLIFLLFMFLVINSRAQDDNLSLQFKRILFKDLVDTLEKKVQIKIYYTNRWVDSLYLNIDSENVPVDGLLRKALNNEGFSFILTDDNKIILSKGYSIKTNFQEQYNAYMRKNIIKNDLKNYVGPEQQEDNVRTNDEYRVYKIGKPSENVKGDKAVLSGTVINPVSGNPVVGAVVYVEKIKAGAVTNEAGFYSLSLPKGQYQLECRMIGMRSTIRNLIIFSDGILDIEMSEFTNKLNEVVVFANKENMVKNVRLGVEKINIKMLRQIPMGMGEADLIKSVLLLPGVQTVGEASGGYNVRGGSADQNLVLLNNAPIINSSHFFGFFSAFNSDLITDVTLYKNGTPAKFGGLLSSVME
jgi:hypothetical protein